MGGRSFNITRGAFGDTILPVCHSAPTVVYGCEKSVLPRKKVKHSSQKPICRIMGIWFPYKCTIFYKSAHKNTFQKYQSNKDKLLQNILRKASDTLSPGFLVVLWSPASRRKIGRISVTDSLDWVVCNHCQERFKRGNGCNSHGQRK